MGIVLPACPILSQSSLFGPIRGLYDYPFRGATGPHVVETVAGKVISVHLGEATGPRHFNICQVKPSLLYAQVMFLNSVAESKEDSKKIWWTEVISKNDPRANSMPMKGAIQKEIN
jgi:hypothetical protein